MHQKHLPTIVVLMIILAVLFFAPFTSLAEPIDSETPYEEPEMARALVLDLLYEEESEYGFQHQMFVAEILSGPYKGEQVLVENVFSGNPAMDMVIENGDRLIIALEIYEGQIAAAYPQDFYREFYLYLLIGLFVLVIVLVGRMKGLKAVLTLGITIFLIAQVMLPAMLRGHDPLLLAIAISILVTTITLTIIGGLNTKTVAAIFGTTGGVLIAALISLLVGNAAKLTGLSAQEAQMLMYIADDVGFNFKNLLFAGIIIGALGAVMDVSISIASAMEEIKAHSPKIRPKELIQSGMNVGKDIMGTMTNTLILAYTGTSIPLLLLLLTNQQSYLKIINLDFVATEFVRALSGSIGLIFAIPITALASAFLMKLTQKNRAE